MARHQLSFFVAVLSSFSFAYNFGSPGSHGMSGPSGYSGENGRSVITELNGSPISLDLSGRDGSAGGYGERGRDAHGCSQPAGVAYNVQGADGGDGGHGGSGGNGGYGGNLTLYFSDLAHVKNVFVRGTPGRGNYGGYGADGGRGCRCSIHSWQVTTNGTTQTYYCTDGRNGNHGGNGSHGSNGSYGRVRLINAPYPLPADASDLSVSIPTLAASTVTLIKNVWSERNGGRILFSSGSDLSDRYSWFERTVRKLFTTHWNAPESVSAFSTASLSLSLAGTGAISILPSGFMFDGTEQDLNGELHELSITHAVTNTDAMKIQIKKIAGSGASAKLALSDSAGVSSLLKNKIYLDFATRKLLIYSTRWKGIVPENALHVSSNEISIDLGRLGMDSQYLDSGTHTQIDVTVSRNMQYGGLKKGMGAKIQIQ